ENPFKARSYALAAFEIEKLNRPLASLSPGEIRQIKGIGEAIGKKIELMLQEGKFPLLEKYLAETPAGVQEMLHIKGLGPKKISIIWKEMGIESIGELLYACHENRLLHHKGFGPKSQESIKQEILFYLSQKGKFLYAEIASQVKEALEQLQQRFPQAQFVCVGDFRRQLEIIDRIEILTDVLPQELQKAFPGASFQDEQSLRLPLSSHLPVQIFFATAENWGTKLFVHTGSTGFVQHMEKQFPGLLSRDFAKEEALFADAHLQVIPPCLRDDPHWIKQARSHQLPSLIQVNDIKGIIHAHSHWSDGAQSLEEMAKACMQQGFEYLVICDHSQSAFYANGLSPERIKAQHQEIDALNASLHPFKIFKGIEADILPDGRLDYPDEILASFDVVIASVHSGLNMPQEKAMQRLLKAISHPFTTILGHMTGRLLLSRNGYPVDHHAIIQACKQHRVIIELNAHPRRLDIDWRWIPEATEAGVMISIDPDAHHISGFQDIRYGVLVAQKGGLTARQNFSSLSKHELEAYLLKRKNGS
ncbi:MAG: DNA polymerase/3'-5' exonuclease PolX, partial [Thermoflavifilum sp.]|nr:DNA polymerase/3'-5' exonuclease PolX [Thermoflavifilum sp.]